jgi:hypothetical protein
MPVYFMQMVADILQEYIEKTYQIIFIDNISIVSDIIVEYNGHLYAVIDTWQKNNIYLKDNKYSYSQSETEFMSYWIIGSNI